MGALREKLSKKTDDELLFYIDIIDKHIDGALRKAYQLLQENQGSLQ